MKEFEIRDVGSRHGRRGKGMYKLIWTMNTKDNFENLGVNGILKEHCTSMWNGFIWVSNGTEEHSN